MSERLPPLPPGEWPAEMPDVLAAMTPPKVRHPFPERREDRPKGRNVLGLFAHHPELARAFLTFNGHILFATTLDPRQRELIVLRVAHRRDAAYEWAQHRAAAHDEQITDDEVARVRVGPDAEGWDPLDAALLRATDELLDDARIGEATYALLADHLSTEQLLDVVFTVGAYEVVAMAMRTFDLPLDDDLQKWK